MFNYAISAKPPQDSVEKLQVETVEPDVDQLSKNVATTLGAVSSLESGYSGLSKDLESWKDRTQKHQSQCDERLAGLEDRVKKLEAKYSRGSGSSGTSSTPVTPTTATQSGGSSGTVASNVYQTASPPQSSYSYRNTASGPVLYECNGNECRPVQSGATNWSYQSSQRLFRVIRR
jgi:exonuclease VII small subunit